MPASGFSSPLIYTTYSYIPISSPSIYEVYSYVPMSSLLTYSYASSGLPDYEYPPIPTIPMLCQPTSAFLRVVHEGTIQSNRYLGIQESAKTLNVVKSSVTDVSVCLGKVDYINNLQTTNNTEYSSNYLDSIVSIQHTRAQIIWRLLDTGR